MSYGVSDGVPLDKVLQGVYTNYSDICNGLLQFPAQILTESSDRRFSLPAGKGKLSFGVNKQISSFCNLFNTAACS